MGVKGVGVVVVVDVEGVVVVVVVVVPGVEVAGAVVVETEEGVVDDIGVDVVVLAEEVDPKYGAGPGGGGTKLPANRKA